MKTNNNKKIQELINKCSAFCKFVPNLLLSYTYSLNTAHTKSISIGFDVQTFEERIILDDTFGDFIELTSLDWYSIFVKLQKLNNITHQMINTKSGNCEKSKLNVSRNLQFQIKKDANDIYIDVIKVKDAEKHTITLDFEEYLNFYALTDFIHMVVTYNRSTSALISAYFDLYVAKCVELNTFVLTPHHYFTPPNYIGHSTINYSRLFNEFSFLCSLKIYKAIECEKVKKKNGI